MDILVFIKAYLIMFLAGIGFVRYLIRKHFPAVTLSVLLAPIVGSLIIIILGVFLLYFKVGFVWQRIAISVEIIISVLLFGLFNSKLCYTKSLKISHIKSLFFTISMCVILIIAIGICLNMYKDGLLYHRLSPDTAAYLSSSIHLSEGHSLSEVNNAFAIEILLKTLRWGFPFLISIIVGLGAVYVHEVLFPVIYILFLSGVFSVASLYSNMCEGQQRKSFVFLYSFFCICNVAILNFLNEGFYPQILTLIFMNVIFALFFYLRNLQIKSVITVFPIFGLIILLFSGIIAVYSEAFILIMLFIGGCFFIDLFLDRKMVKLDIMMFFVALMSIILVYPIGFGLLKYTFLNTMNIKNVGYPLPAWMMPSDILGLTNIFSRISAYLDNAVAVHLIKRKPFEMIIVLSASIWGISEIVRVLRRNKDRTFILMLIVIPFSFFLLNIFKLNSQGGYPPVNYLYNKLVSMFILSLVALFAMGINSGDNGGVKRKIKIVLGILLVSVSVVMFLVDSQKYRVTTDTKIIDMFKSYPELTEKYVYVSMPRGYRNGKIIGKYRYIDRTDDFIISSIIPGIKFIDQWNVEQWRSLPNNLEIVILARKSDLGEAAIARIKKGNILMEDRTYILIKTSHVLCGLVGIDDLMLLINQQYG